mmetsp:Transcript_5946/g.19417  ORF Transcript_5946/g.19417 Transcript_5946/m.19417 type:complete len:205 (+) Transcript_5946:2169-2783(+)
MPASTWRTPRSNCVVAAASSWTPRVCRCAAASSPTHVAQQACGLAPALASTCTRRRCAGRRSASRCLRRRATQRWTAWWCKGVPSASALGQARLHASAGPPSSATGTVTRVVSSAGHGGSASRSPRAPRSTRQRCSTTSLPRLPVAFLALASGTERQDEAVALALVGEAAGQVLLLLLLLLHRMAGRSARRCAERTRSSTAVSS